MNDELRALREARVARQAANPTHSEVVLGEGESLTRVKLVEVHGQALGSSLWESGTLLAEFLVSPEGRALVEGKDRAMELGCGVGLPGLALALLLGRREVPGRGQLVAWALGARAALFLSSFPYAAPVASALNRGFNDAVLS